MRALWILVGLAALAVTALGAARVAVGAPTLEERLARIDRETAGRLLALAGSADRAKQPRAVQRIYRRMLELDPEQAAARRELGWKKGPNGWTRERAPAVPPPPSDPEARARAERIAVEVRVLEAARAEQVVTVCEQAGEREAAKPYVLALLEQSPRLERIHAALGHERVDGRFVRPELLALARRRMDLEATWVACRTPEGAALSTLEPTGYPTLADRTWLRAGARRVSGTLPPEALRRLAGETECTHRFLRLLLGDGATQYDPKQNLFCDVSGYADFVRSRQPDAAKQEALLRIDNYSEKGLLVLRARESYASDFYTHNVAFFTARDLGSPVRVGAPKELNYDANAWWREGLGYFATLELWGSTSTTFHSTDESNAKSRGLIEPPALRDPASLHVWLLRLLESGDAYPLREVIAFSLNSLDYTASIEAASFVRFLALLDPAGFVRLPAELRSRAEGSEPERADAALTAAFGRGLDLLAADWRHWMRESS